MIQETKEELVTKVCQDQGVKLEKVEMLELMDLQVHQVLQALEGQWDPQGLLVTL